VRVAFNAQLLSYRPGYRAAGISRYIDRTLAHLEPHLKGTGSVAFVGPDVPASAEALAWLTVRQTRLPTQHPIVRILWEQIVLPVAIRQSSADLVHCPAYASPFLGGRRAVVTFHDLSFRVMPEAFNRSNRLYLDAFSRLAAASAARFIAVSEATRRDLVAFLGISRERIDVVYNGVDRRFQPYDNQDAMRAFRESKGLPEQFILFLGTLEPRKNVPMLVKAYAAARQRGVTAPLVLAGGGGWGDLRLRALIAELGLESSVRLAGFVAMDEQVLWYNAATLFAFPSLYEGFGLPVLEAMACGTPVITSNQSSLPEVVGTAGITVDPHEPDSLADALVAAMRDEEARADLSARGLSQARSFTWERAAQETYDTFRRAIGTYPAGIRPR
jgi:glycosyltransferase involved in cell wall biosynthesis